ncbi:MAG: CDP-alcohol phosphatidyltransferase family protein [Parcubacteria group bacterium]|nr:CDP-alcohol phosphatidyltransferase family protein [Parcubacteria group bacterium]
MTAMFGPHLKLQDRLYQKTILKLVPERVHPNHVTLARFVLTPFVVWLVLEGYYGWGVVAFLLVAFTDTLDGSMARVRDKITPWGMIYDPVADKLLIGSLVGILVIQHLDVYLAVAIISIEVLFIALGWWWISSGVQVQANRWGKIKMVLQVIGVTMLLIGLATGFSGFLQVSSTTFYLAIVFAIISLFTSGV